MRKSYFFSSLLGEQYLSLHKFGMYAEGLAALTGFFRSRWRSVYKDLSSSQQAQVLIVTGYCLRAVGALDDAAMATGLAQNLYEPIDINEAADAAGNLTQMLVVSGKLREAIKSGLKAVEIGALCPDPKRRKERYNLASLADAYHQAGMLKESEQCFARSEQLQGIAFPEWPFLISYRGFLYCDLLLALGRLKEVRKRAKSSLGHPKSPTDPGIQGLDHLSIGRSYLMENPPRVNRARASLRKAEQLVRQGGHLDELPRVLLAVAQLRLFEDDAERALKEVRQAHWLSERTGQNLRIVDSLIVRGQIEFRRRYRRKAAKTLEDARDLAKSMGYAGGLLAADNVIH